MNEILTEEKKKSLLEAMHRAVRIMNEAKDVGTDLERLILFYIDVYENSCDLKTEELLRIYLNGWEELKKLAEIHASREGFEFYRGYDEDMLSNKTFHLLDLKEHVLATIERKEKEEKDE